MTEFVRIKFERMMKKTEEDAAADALKVGKKDETKEKKIAAHKDPNQDV